jgi:DNA-binding FadR family transcriptional regulator
MPIVYSFFLTGLARSRMIHQKHNDLKSTMTFLPQVKPVSIRQTGGESIRHALLEGLFCPGQPLSEVALASETAVSREVIREALFVLTPELLNEQHRSSIKLLSGSPGQTTDQCVRFDLGL